MRYPPIIKNFPHMIHGADYNPDQWIQYKDTIWKEDMRLAKLAGMNSLSVGIFAWATLEPKEDEYHIEWLDQIMDMMAENGMKAVLATPSGARPAWMSQQHPEVLRVDANRVRILHGGRHNHCLSSPYYREKVQAINTILAERYKDHPALGLWHISNEYGGECHCELCQEKFRTFLKHKYTDLATLNDAWWTSFWSHRYSDWSQIESPAPHGETNTHGLLLDWKRFTTEHTIDFYKNEIEPMRRYTPEVACTANLMGTYPGIDYFRFAQELDVVSWDAYPHWTNDARDIGIAQKFSFYHDLTRGLKNKPFLLMESSPSCTNWQPIAKLHRPGVHQLASLQAVAHGADSVQYFQMRKGRGASEKFHGAVIDHEGTENTRVFREVAQLGKVLSSLDDIVGTDTPSKVAILYDWNNRWAIDDSKGFLQNDNHYEDTVIDHYRSFWSMGIPVDIIDSTCDFASYDLLITPMLYMLRGDIAARIESFVRSGGRYVATYMTGYVNDTDLCFLGGFPGPLKTTLGIWNEEIDALMPGGTNTIEYAGNTYQAYDLCEVIHARGAQTLGTYTTDFYQGTPVVTQNACGKGTAYYIAARTEQSFLDDFYGSLAEQMELPRALDATLPEGVTAQIRTDGETSHVFLLNFTNQTQTIEVAHSSVAITLAPYGVEILKR